MILKILERYSDEYRPLTQKRILELLDIEYGMKCDRRSVKSNLISLRTCLKSFKNSFGVERVLYQFFQSLWFLPISNFENLSETYHEEFTELHKKYRTNKSGRIISICSRE